MEYTTLGSTGLTVSRLCLGTDRFANSYDTDENETEPVGTRAETRSRTDR